MTSVSERVTLPVLVLNAVTPELETAPVVSLYESPVPRFNPIASCALSSVK